MKEGSSMPVEEGNNSDISNSPDDEDYKNE